MENQNFKESQGQIVNNLTLIDSFLNQEKISAENAEELHKIYSQTINWIDDNFSNLETDITFQLLEFLNFYYEVKSLG